MKLVCALPVRQLHHLFGESEFGGHLRQERFFSFVVDETHLLAFRYVENNPVRVILVKKPKVWPWSSAPAHINAEDDIFVKVPPAFSIARDNWDRFLSEIEKPNNSIT